MHSYFGGQLYERMILDLRRDSIAFLEARNAIPNLNDLACDVKSKDARQCFDHESIVLDFRCKGVSFESLASRTARTCSSRSPSSS